MASTYSALKIQLMATGDNDGTWGDVTNQNFLAFQEMINGTANVVFANADVVLTLVDSNASQPARNLRLILTGTTGGPRTLTIPGAVFKQFIVANSTPDTITVKVAGGGPGYPVISGISVLLYNDGNNVADIVSYVSSLFLNGLTVFGNASVQGTFNAVGASSIGGILTLGSGFVTNTITGLLKGQGTSGAVVAATQAVDYAAPNFFNNWTGTQTFSGTSAIMATRFRNAQDIANLPGTAIPASPNFDITTSSLFWYTASATQNWSVNFRASATTSLDTAMNNGDEVTVVVATNMGATPFNNQSIFIDGVQVPNANILWQGNVRFPPGNPNGVDVYTYSIWKFSAANFVVFASQAKFA